MDKVIFQKQQSLYYICIPVFYRKSKYTNVVNGDVRQTSTGNSCGKSQGLNNATFQGSPRGVGQTCFLNSTLKHIKLTGYSRLYSEWQWHIIPCNLWFKKIIETKIKHGDFRDILIMFILRVCGSYLNIFKNLTLARIFPINVYLNLFGGAHFH